MDRANFDRSDLDVQLPAIEIVLGWETDRLIGELPVVTAQIWVILAIIWIGVIVGGLVGDWSLSVALGQLFAASLALVYTLLNKDRASARRKLD